MTANARDSWSLAIQIFKGGDWFPLKQHGLVRDVLVAREKAHAHIRQANRQQLDPRNLAIFSFGRGEFEQVPWR